MMEGPGPSSLSNAKIEELRVLYTVTRVSENDAIVGLSHYALRARRTRERITEAEIEIMIRKQCESSERMLFRSAEFSSVS